MQKEQVLLNEIMKENVRWSETINGVILPDAMSEGNTLWREECDERTLQSEEQEDDMLQCEPSGDCEMMNLK